MVVVCEESISPLQQPPLVSLENLWRLGFLHPLQQFTGHLPSYPVSRPVRREISQASCDEKASPAKRGATLQLLSWDRIRVNIVKKRSTALSRLEILVCTGFQPLQVQCTEQTQQCKSLLGACTVLWGCTLEFLFISTSFSVKLRWCDKGPKFTATLWCCSYMTGVGNWQNSANVSCRREVFSLCVSFDTELSLQDFTDDSDDFVMRLLHTTHPFPH